MESKAHDFDDGGSDMGGDGRIDGGPRSAIVVGAGIVGLSTAWFLQERGVDVTVVDGCGVATGASWDDIVAALVWLAPHAEARGFPLKAGQTIITGARVAAPLSTADLVEGKLGNWGKVSARCTY